MITLRKIDLYIQVALGILTILSIPFLYLYGLLGGLLILGCWQLFSASLNTNSFLATGYGKRICTYWKWNGIAIALLFLCIPLSWLFNPDNVQVLGAIAISGAIQIAIFYIVIYMQLIDHLNLRDELSGVIKSHH